MTGNWSLNVQTVYDPTGRKDEFDNVYIIYKAVATTIRNYAATPVPPTGWSVSTGIDKNIQQIIAYADTWPDMCVKISALTPYNDKPVPANIGG